MKAEIFMSDTNTVNAITFLQLASRGKVKEAYSKFVGDGFRHHNPFYEWFSGIFTGRHGRKCETKPEQSLHHSEDN